MGNEPLKVFGGIGLPLARVLKVVEVRLWQVCGRPFVEHLFIIDSISLNLAKLVKSGADGPTDAPLGFCRSGSISKFSLPARH